MKNKLMTAAMLAPFAAASLAGAQATGADSFDTSKLESTSTAILAVGALIAVGFAIYKVGKRGLGKV